MMYMWYMKCMKYMKYMSYQKLSGSSFLHSSRSFFGYPFGFVLTFVLTVLTEPIKTLDFTAFYSFSDFIVGNSRMYCLAVRLIISSHPVIPHFQAICAYSAAISPSISPPHHRISCFGNVLTAVLTVLTVISVSIPYQNHPPTSGVSSSLQPSSVMQ